MSHRGEKRRRIREETEEELWVDRKMERLGCQTTHIKHKHLRR
jgi:hypothetical protein